MVVMRTFSKAYGLAGLRVGWMAGPPDLIAALTPVRNAFDVNALAQAAAVASLAVAPVTHFERAGVVPIAFCLFHIVNMIDSSFMLITGEMPTWNDDWKAKVQMSIPDHGKHKTVDEMIEQRADLAVHRADDEEIAFVERAVLHEDARHRTTATVELRLEHRALCHAARVRLNVGDVGHEEDHFE